MDLVTPVMTFDIGAMAPLNNPKELFTIKKAINECTDYVREFLFPQFSIFTDDVHKLIEFKSLSHQPLTVDECLTYLVKDIEYKIPLESFNNDAGNAFIFFDNFYYCIINKDGLDYADTDKIERYMLSRINTIKDIHSKMSKKHMLTLNDRHIIIFVNFLITLRNKPFDIWELIGDDDGNVKLVK